MRFFGHLRLTYPTHVACTCHVPPSTFSLSLFLSLSSSSFSSLDFSVVPLPPRIRQISTCTSHLPPFDGIREDRARRHPEQPVREKSRSLCTHYADFFCYFVTLPPIRRSWYYGDTWRRVARSMSVHAHARHEHVEYVVP